VNVAGAAVIKGTEQQAAAEDFVAFLLSDETQEFFADESKEYPLVAGIKQDSSLIPLSAIQQPDVELTDLDDLEGSLELIEESGALK
jgi:iron(III) transport system substrate-binding protein